MLCRLADHAHDVRMPEIPTRISTAEISSHKPVDNALAKPCSYMVCRLHCTYMLTHKSITEMICTHPDQTGQIPSLKEIPVVTESG